MPSTPLFEHSSSFDAGQVGGHVHVGRFEAAYEQLFAEVLEDGVITAEERHRLERAATDLGLDRDRIAHLERALTASYETRNRVPVRRDDGPPSDHLAPASLAPMAASADPKLQLLAIFHAFRHFAHAHPQSYALLFARQTAGERPDEQLLTGLALSLQSIIAQISGEARALAALRGALALAHGYVMLEHNQQLRRGGDLDATYEQVIQAYLAGWTVGQ